jgi:molecular chaperone DnaK (HSP70)
MSFTTSDFEQPNFGIKLIEGERKMAKNNHAFSHFSFSDYKPGPRGEVLIRVTFEVDIDGLLTVTVQEIVKGKKISTKVSPSQDRFTVQDVEAHMAAPEIEIVKDEFEALLRSTSITLQQPKQLQKLKLDPKDLEEIQQSIQENLEWLEVPQLLPEIRKRKQEFQELKNKLVPDSDDQILMVDAGTVQFVDH